MKIPLLNNNFYFHVNATTIYLRNKKNPKFLFSINNDGMSFLKKCNGINPLEILLNDYNKKEQKNILAFLELCVNFGILKFIEKPLTSPKKFLVIGSSKKVSPQVVTLELTEKCNFKCKYCYQNSHPNKKGFLENPLEILKFLKENYVSGIELSGGEPFLHPNIIEILDFCSDNFLLLGILTNGSLIQDRHLKLLKSKNDKCLIAFQVCLDGPNEKIVSNTTQVKNSFEMEKNAIKKIKQYNFPLRVGYVIDTSEKINYIEETLILAKTLGADSFIVSPAMDFGRAKQHSLLTPEEFSIFFKKISLLKKQYPDFLNIEGDFIKEINSEGNCGAGHRNIVINWAGKVKPCVMAPADLFSICDWNEINKEKVIKKFKKLYELKAPSIETCRTCNMLAYCYGCYIRGMKMAIEKKIDCNWFKKYRNILEKVKHDSVRKYY